MAHLKRSKAPKTWKIQTKGITFIVRPMPGPHKLSDCIPLSLVIKKLGYAETTKEVKKILNQGTVLVDNVVRKDHKFPVGTMDSVTFVPAKESYRILISKENVIMQPIKDAEAASKLNKIIGKTILSKKGTQLNLYDGKNLVVKKDTYLVGIFLNY